MKIILSRKGFDGSSGGCANPILEDGRLLPLPIPDPASPIRYDDIAGREDLGAWVADLTAGRLTGRDRAHLDPDLDFGHLPRAAGWRPLFGQSGAAAGHLAGQGIGPGDLFLFFGWFRQAGYRRGRRAFEAGAPDRHIFLGWLQIDRVVTLAEGHPPEPWMRYHPHCHGSRGRGSLLFVARERLSLPGLRATAQPGVPPSVSPEVRTTAQPGVLPSVSPEVRTTAQPGVLPRVSPEIRTTAQPGVLPNLSPEVQVTALPGAGLFPVEKPELVLTRPGASRRCWRLPAWCHPDGRESHLSYHGDPRRWQRDQDGVSLQSVSRGQEFVLDGHHYPEAIPWAANLLNTAANP